MTMIYFAEAVGLHVIKIGFSETDSGVDRRLRNIQSSCPSEVRELARFDGCWADENWLHRKLAPINVRGEWFLAIQEIRRVLRRFHGEFPLTETWKNAFRSIKICRRRWNPMPYRRVLAATVMRVRKLARQKPKGRTRRNRRLEL